MIRTKNKSSILGTAPDLIVLMDTYEKHNKIPEDAGALTSKLDLYIFSRT